MQKKILHSSTFVNPILSGGYPDPSICRVGKDYYLVNSSFEYFPGLPIHHSNDLVNWELVGYGLHRPEQCQGEMNLMDVSSDGGIHAPTIRFHEGTFYIITTNVYTPPREDKTVRFINFILTAKNIKGPWSDPHVLEGAPGIDPDIFFDDDGKVWYTGTHTPYDPEFDGQGEIWLQEIDLQTWALTGERFFLWRGACGGLWVEGPHLYKRNGWYYLLVAEGGTSFNHAVMVAVSKDIRGPYTSNPRNPIFTSRHLSYDNWVHSTGHGDLVELQDGRWYMVVLGIRADEGRGSNMGRETHLVPVIWEREPFEWKMIKHDWPVCAPHEGRVARISPSPFGDTRQSPRDSFSDDFTYKELDLEWNFRRVPAPGIYSLKASPGHLRLFAQPEVIRERASYSFIGFRQRETDFEFVVSMKFTPEGEGDEAGVALIQKDDSYLIFTVLHQDGSNFLRLVLAEPEKLPRVLKQDLMLGYNDRVVFRLGSGDHRWRYQYSLDDCDTYRTFTETNANLLLSRGYTGAYLGLYATSNGHITGGYADYDWVRYQGFPRGLRSFQGAP